MDEPKPAAVDEDDAQRNGKAAAQKANAAPKKPKKEKGEGERDQDFGAGEGKTHQFQANISLASALVSFSCYDIITGKAGVKELIMAFLARFPVQKAPGRKPERDRATKKEDGSRTRTSR
jgi:hypothetical protein